MQIRLSVPADLPELLYIYNYEILNGTATLDLTEQTLDKRKEWFDALQMPHHPLICAQADDGKIAGYASLSPYRNKEAYCSTAELSVYVHPDYRRQGIAKLLMTHILDMARKDPELHTVVSVITAGNQVSVHLHEAFGFIYCGKIRNVAVKFGKNLDIDHYELFV